MAAWLTMTRHSASSSGPGLARMRSGIATLPTSCSSPPRRQRKTIAGGSPSSRAMAADSSETCSQCSSGMPSRTDVASASACAMRTASGSSASRSSPVRSIARRVWSRPRRLAA